MRVAGPVALCGAAPWLLPWLPPAANVRLAPEELEGAAAGHGAGVRGGAADEERLAEVPSPRLTDPDG